MTSHLKPVASIRKQRVFQYLFQNGKRSWAKHLGMWFCKTVENEEREGSSVFLGIVVSRKASKKATIRNKWKRRIRELMRKHQAEWLKPGYYLVNIKPGQDVVPESDELQQELQKLIERTHRQ